MVVVVDWRWMVMVDSSHYIDNRLGMGFAEGDTVVEVVVVVVVVP